jgi:hypothetical protein
MKKERKVRNDSDSHLGYWIFLVGCWIFKKGEYQERVLTRFKENN